MSTLAVNTITNAAGGNTAQINGMTPTAQSLQGFRNRIINGNMVIDQRSNGASVTPGNGTYTIDRWQAFVSQASKITIQQNAGSVTPPAGFTSYLGVTVGASANVTVGSSDYFFIQQAIEGHNVADLGFGAAGAATITFSFWVRSSVTGTYGGVLYNGGGSRSYPYSYVVNSANTWEQKTVTVVGDTTGTWQTTTGAGLQLTFSLGTGSTYNGAAGSWAGANYYGTTGAATPITTNGATFYITGVQLEAGSVATPFERRPYGTELALCQRYYEVLFADNAGEAGFSAPWSTSQRWIWHMKVQKRAMATFALVGSGNWQVTTPTNVNGGVSSIGAFHTGTNYYLQGAANTAAGSASAEL